MSTPHEENERGDAGHYAAEASLSHSSIDPPDGFLKRCGAVTLTVPAVRWTTRRSSPGSTPACGSSAGSWAGAAPDSRVVELDGVLAAVVPAAPHRSVVQLRGVRGRRPAGAGAARAGGVYEAAGVRGLDRLGTGTTTREAAGAAGRARGIVLDGEPGGDGDGAERRSRLPGPPTWTSTPSRAPATVARSSTTSPTARRRPSSGRCAAAAGSLHCYVARLDGRAGVLRGTPRPRRRHSSLTWRRCPRRAAAASPAELMAPRAARRPRPRGAPRPACRPRRWATRSTPGWATATWARCRCGSGGNPSSRPGLPLTRLVMFPTWQAIERRRAVEGCRSSPATWPTTSGSPGRRSIRGAYGYFAGGAGDERTLRRERRRRTAAGSCGRGRWST